MEKSDGTSIEQAINRMDAAGLLKLVEAGDGDTATEALRSLWASDALFDKRTSKKVSKREPFLEAVAVGLEQLYPEIAMKARELPGLLRLVEKGYLSVLTHTKATVGGSLPPLRQISAALTVAALTANQLQRLGVRQWTNDTTFELKSNLIINDASVNADVALNGVISAAIATLMMMSHEQGWFNKNDQVELPSLLPCSSDEDIEAIGSVLRHADNWFIWERSQLRMRLAMRTPEYLSKPYPKEFPASASSVLSVLPSEKWEIIDFISNNRLLARTKQHYFELLQRLHDFKEPILNASIPLLPEMHLSFDEIHGLNTITEWLSYDVLNDQTRYVGLRIVEWLRGYAALKRIAQLEQASDDTNYQFSQISTDELIAILTRAGLTSDCASIFLQHACLTKSRNDIFDRPLVRLGQHHYLIMGPAIRSAVLGPVVLSTISDSGCEFKPKGKAFEKTLRNIVAGPGRQVGYLKAKRGGEEYEYDALLVWEDYCFLLECKNHSLSGGILQQVYRSELESRSHALQVQRLVDGLMNHPDMLDKEFPAARGKILVPCVISALPFSVPGGVEGVLFGDSSMLKRFFASSTMGQVSFQNGQPAQRVPGTEKFRLWSKNEPSPLDLLRHLICSFQYILTRDHISMRTFVTDIFPEENLLYHGEYMMSDITLESFSDAAARYESLIPLSSVEQWKEMAKRVP
ncbi:hypothetical protein FHY13_003117 [Xanthomonas arboricola]|nr:hypothetical protein [Xanthomonas euroxanthea]